MSNVLMVPLHLDALVLETDRFAVEAMADFARLPYRNEERDVNPDVPYLSEEIASKPLQNQNLLLKAGIHLHWALPDALTHQGPDETENEFPAVPDRWLITRSRKDPAGSTVQVDKQWIVESNYLYLADSNNELNITSVNIPLPVDLSSNERRTFGYLGRKLPLAAWSGIDSEASYLEPLTAVGYGEPAFAAFYPNCHSVFGFHDDEVTEAMLGELQYDILGWYSNDRRDHLRQFIERFLTQPENQQNDDGLIEAVAENFQWAVSVSVDKTFFWKVIGINYGDEDFLWDHLLEQGWLIAIDENTASIPPKTQRREAKLGYDFLQADVEKIETNLEKIVINEFPTQMVCYAGLDFDPDANGIDNPAAGATDTTVTIGNTGTEALSAFLARTIDSSRKEILEDQLEALYLAADLEHRQVDIGPKFDEARHEKGFTAIKAGSIWTIRPEANPDSQAADTHQNRQATLPDDLAWQLNDLNRLQGAYDQATHEIEALRHRLFSDWYKYLLCAYPSEYSREEYPDIDLVKHYIEVKAITALQAHKAATGKLALDLDENENIIGASAPESDDGSLAAQVAQALNTLLADLSRLDSQQLYILKQIAAPRYWQPNEPVVLLTGQAAQPTERHGQDGRLREDGLLECWTFDKAEIPYPLTKDSFTALRNEFGVIRAAMDRSDQAPDDLEPIAFRSWHRQPWHPFLLEWEVEMLPIKNKSNLQPDSHGYGLDFITDNYQLAENAVDLSRLAGREVVMKGANVYRGATILSSHAPVRLKQVWAELLSRDSSFLTPLRDAYPKFENLKALSQSLGGFNEALLMHKQTMQLSVADPLGFDDYQPFAAAVAAAVEGRIKSAPEPFNDFNPIRSGVMKIRRLRLVDTFGQANEPAVTSLLTTNGLSTPGNSELVSLPPRLVQPARLNFRWLSAGQGQQEMNDHPATTPICGWLLPNHLDNSLMIYDGDGNVLGSINQAGHWQASPGSDQAVIVSQIANPYLRNVVEYITHRDRPDAFVRDFISVLDAAVANIEPENFEQHQDLAILMGRPLAVVRASLNLELQGLPAIDHSWIAFRQDLTRTERETDHFTDVTFPIRLGEYRQLNDGLAGYWLEAEDGGYRDGIFFAPQSEPGANAHIKTHGDEPLNIRQTLAAPAQTVTMLIDPRGQVHATCGILPTKAIHLPPDQYTNALQQIEITFLSAPILTRQDEIHLPLPAEPGYGWSWVQKSKAGWSEISTHGLIKKQVIVAAFEDGELIWQLLVDQKWVREIDETKAFVTPKDQRMGTDLGTNYEAQLPKIEHLLDRAYIGGITPEATFSGPLEIREGWLKLSKVEQN